MIRILSPAGLLTLSVFIFLSACAVKEDKAALEPPAVLSDQVREIIEKEIKSAAPTQKSRLFVHFSATLPAFYEKENYKPAWSDDNGLLPQAEIFINIIREAENDGLKPADYHLYEIESAIKEIYKYQSAKQSEGQTFFNPKDLAKLDLMLTDAFLLYGSHLLNGRVNPEEVDTAWLVKHHEGDLTEILRSAISSNRIEETLNNLRPKHEVYSQLQKALIKYREIAAKGGWHQVPPGPKMKKGYRGESVLLLRNRLIATGDLAVDEARSIKISPPDEPSESYVPASGAATIHSSNEPNKNEDLFDHTLEEALRNFQRRHGLKPDGVLDSSTLDALNVPVEKRISQIELNMERLRWLPKNLGSRYVMVNIANFELYAVEKNETVMKMRVVVGKPYWNTPVFSGNMSHIVLNPTWNVPPSIIVEEIRAKVQKDPAYLSKAGFKVYDSDSKTVDPNTIDWSKVTENDFNYRLQQQPGPGNALGRIKFMFPNQFNVYMHDTPHKKLFARTERNFSHGCIRVEKPFDLAEYVLRPDPEWGYEKIEQQIKKGRTQTVNLQEPVPVYILYFTAWADENGMVEFRDDIYERDNALEMALSRAEPAT